jgi:hypothetical protein
VNIDNCGCRNSNVFDQDGVLTQTRWTCYVITRRAYKHRIFFMALQPLEGLLIIEVSRSHSDTPHSVGLLWKSDRSVARNYLTTHNTHMLPAGCAPEIPSKRTGADPRLRPRGLKLSPVLWIFGEVSRLQAMSCLHHLVVSILPWRPWFDLRTLGRVFLCVLRCSRISIIYPLLHNPVSVMCYWH